MISLSPNAASTSTVTGWCSSGLGGEALVSSRRPWLVIDTETTGLDPTRDQIVEFAALVMDENLNTRATHRWSRRDGPLTLAECVEEVSPVVRVGTVVAHNLAFDLAFLQAEPGRPASELANPGRWLCTMRLTGARTSLASLAQALRVDPVDLHTAAGDTHTLAVVLSRLISSAKSRGLTTVAGMATVAPVGKAQRVETTTMSDGWHSIRAALDHVVPFPPVTRDQRLAFDEEYRSASSPATAAKRLRSVGITALAFEQLLTEAQQPDRGTQASSMGRG